MSTRELFIRIGLAAIGLTLVIQGIFADENRATSDPAKASYRVRADSGQQSSYGSGTAISRMVIVTNAHVVGPRGTPVVVDQSSARYAGQVIESNATLDLAFVRVEPPTLQWAEYSAGDTTIGQPCTLYGYTRAGPLNVREGNITVNATTEDGQPRRWLNIQVRDGDSGGGVFDISNKLVAIVQATGYYDGEGSAIPATLITQLMDEIKTRYDQEGIAYTVHTKCEKCGGFHERKKDVDLVQL